VSVTLSPDMLILNTWDSPERVYMTPLLRKLREGGYDTYVEPMACAFVMPSLAAESGWLPKQMHTSDVSLFAAVIGTMLSGGNLEDLHVELDGAILEIAGIPPIKQASIILWSQLLGRLEHRAGLAVYWHEAVSDLYVRRKRHLEQIEKGLELLLGRIEGLRFHVETPWETVERHLDNPKAVIVSNPPTYRNGYEKFFETGGRVRWKNIPYEAWEPAVDQAKLAAMAEGTKALFLIQQQAAPRKEAGEAVYARHLSPGQYVYVWTNRKEEVFKHTNGMTVRPRSPGVIAPYDAPDLPEDYVWHEDAVVQVLPCQLGTAAWYKQRWLHRLAGAEGSYNVIVLIDGYVAGVTGYSFKAIQTPYPGVDAKIWAGATILRYALGAPHETHRSTRLITRIALQRSTLILVASTLPSVMLMAAGSDKIVTTEYTRHPESKGLRGLMKIADRRKDDRDGYRLVYWAPLGSDTAPEAYSAWLLDEQRYIDNRKAKA